MKMDAVCLRVSLCVCGYMIIGRHKKMLSSNWLQNFQYNHNEPGHGRLLYIRKAWLLTVHQFVQAGFVCLFGLKADIHSIFDRGLGLDLTKRGYRN